MFKDFVIYSLETQKYYKLFEPKNGYQHSMQRYIIGNIAIWTEVEEDGDSGNEKEVVTKYARLRAES